MLPRYVDYDRITRSVLSRVAKAIRWWIRGEPVHEEPLLNHLTGRLGTRQRCDVGLNRKVMLDSRVELLHRKGPDQTDRFGSDLAITVFVEEDWTFKTAFFQLKRSRDFQAKLDRSQLEDAEEEAAVWDRSFIACFDTEENAVRIAESQRILHGWPTESSSRKVDTAGGRHWESLSDWLRKWFYCKTGKSSEPWNPSGPEALLLAHSKVEELDWAVEWPERMGPEGFYPTQAWLRVTVAEGAE